VSLNFTWLSNAQHANTGYANQTRHTVPRLQELGHNVAIIAFYGVEGGVIKMGETVTYPRGENPWGLDVVDAHTLHFNKAPGGVCISLMDSWVLDPAAFRLTRWCPYFPIDHEPLPPPIKDRVSKAFARIVYSKFGERMMHNADLDCYYVPHLVDCQIFKPKPKRVAREETRLPQDAFIVGMVAANKGAPSRKCFQQQLEAFKILHAKHPDTHMHLHTAQGKNGGPDRVNLPELVDYLGLSDCVTFADPYYYMLGLSDRDVSTVYNTFDVLTSVSMGEGFGIPIVEAQACGVPVIVGDWTAMSELCFGGWMVDKADADPFWTPLAAYQFVPRIGAIAEAMEAAYNGAGDMKLHKQARQGALQYDADDVVKTYWKPVLEDIERHIAHDEARPSFDQLAGVMA
jgi:glycosyltransferase involved in cell wall biosynthesis